MQKTNYKSYCFDHQGHILFFLYNYNHLINTKNIKFQLGKVRIFTQNLKVYSCLLTSNPHLNISLDWNQQYFAKLFHGLASFQLQQDGQSQDQVQLVVKDHFQIEQQIFLMRAKLVQQFGLDLNHELWVSFNRFNLEKIKNIQSKIQQIQTLKIQADNQLMKIMKIQQDKYQQKQKIKQRLSALLRQKQAKLKQFGQNFNPLVFDKQIEPSLDLSQQRDSMSIAGSLFQESIDFHYDG